MKEWVGSICSLVVIVTLASIIIPEGKTSNLIKSLFSLIIILVMIKPIVGINNNEFALEFTDESATCIQTEFIDYSNMAKNTKYQNFCNEIALIMGIKDADTRIEYTVSDKYEYKIEM